MRKRDFILSFLILFFLQLSKSKLILQLSASMSMSAVKGRINCCRLQWIPTQNLQHNIHTRKKKKRLNDQRRVCGKCLKLLFLWKSLLNYLMFTLIILPSTSADPQAFSFLKAHSTEGLNQTAWLLKITYNLQCKVVSGAYLHKLINMKIMGQFICSRKKMATDTESLVIIKEDE